MNAVDTNVFLYSIDRNEPAKQLKAQQLLRQLRASSVPTFLLWRVFRVTESDSFVAGRNQGKLGTARSSSNTCRHFGICFLSFCRLPR